MRSSAGWCLAAAACLLAAAAEDRPGASSCLDDGDLPSNASLACRGARVLWRALDHWLDPAGDVLRLLPDGVSLAKVAEDPGDEARAGGGFLGRASRFAGSHELRVRLGSFVPALEDLAALWKDGADPGQGTGRGKNKGGGLAMVAAMGMMMKGALGAIGLGGAALLAMKALMVSMMALMLSAIVGVKKLSSKDDEGTHHVQVVPVHHSGGDHGHYRRRRRSVDPYRAYLPG